MHEVESSGSEDDTESMIADVSSMPLDAVFHSDDSALSNAMRRLLGDMARPGENYAAHGSTP